MRTLLVVLSIAIGVAALGMVAGTYAVITRDLPASYANVNPASAAIITAPFDEELVRVIRKMEHVKDVEGRYNLRLRLQVGEGEWRDLQLVVIPDFNDIRINRIWSESGAWPPDSRSLLIERASLILARARTGDKVLVETPEGKQRELHISGTAHDLTKPAGTFTNQVNGYVTFETLEWLGYAPDYNELLLSFDGNTTDREFVRSVARQVEEKIEKGGRPVYSTSIPSSKEHWFETYLTPMAFILSVLGGLILLLSGFLVINTISALLAQQMRQIGIMKAIGARTNELVLMYLVSILIIGLLSLGLAIPLGGWAMRASTNVLAGFVNFDIVNDEMPVQVIQLQVILSLLVPILAALFPILNSTRITVREAISDYGLTKANFGASLFDRLLSRVHGFSRPLMLSLRNTFRRKMRLLLTLITLVLGSAIFIAVLSVYASLMQTLDEALTYYSFDVAVFFNRPYRVEQIDKEVRRVPGVLAAETWGITNSRLVRDDGTESETILLVAPPTETELIKPTLIQGRWLVQQDENAIVINTDVLKEDPGIKVGDEVILNIEGTKRSWRVVGIVRSVLIGPWAYTNYPFLSQVLGKSGLAGAVYIATEQRGPAAQTRMAKELEQHFENVGMQVSSVGKVAELRASAIQQFNVVVVFLLIMAGLLSLVGGLGLMGTMSLNVLERTREIGVMRAIGASDGAIMQIVISEGLLIGALSWIGGTVAAIPLSSILSGAVGRGFLNAPLSEAFSVTGAGLWLGVTLGLAALASFLPARSATRLTVRDVLTYE